jgi:hypothetical protein
MAHVSQRLIFRSSQFTVEPGEDQYTNPGIFGKSLAIWVGNELVPGFSAESVISEDFGWLVPVPHPRHALYVACSSTDDSGQQWQLVVFAEGGLLSRLMGKGNHAESVATLYTTLKKRIESEEGVAEIHEEH